MKTKTCSRCKHFCGFSMTIEFCWRQHFEILIIYKSYVNTCEVTKKIGPDRFSRLYVYWIQTNTQTDKQKYIYIYIDT